MAAIGHKAKPAKKKDRATKWVLSRLDGFEHVTECKYTEKQVRAMRGYYPVRRARDWERDQLP